LSDKKAIRKRIEPILLGAGLLVCAVIIGISFKGFLDDSKETLASNVSSEVLIPPVDVNSADLSKLMTLEGMTEDVAIAIIDDRNNYGEYMDTDDLLSVKGVTKKLINDNIKSIVFLPPED